LLESIAKSLPNIDEESLNNLPSILNLSVFKLSMALSKANLPIKGLTVSEGQVLINGLPIDNLSDGEKMELSVEIAKHKAGDLGVVFLDKFESLDSVSREAFLKLCLESDLQFFITLVADGELEVLTIDKGDI